MRYTQLVGIGVVVVLSSGPAWAGQQLRLGPSDGGRRAAAAQEGEVRTARGQLVGVDATAQVLTIKGGDGNREFFVLARRCV